MKAVILAGGLGTRLSEETSTKPKPMVEIGGLPIIWHIMKTYSHHGINDFIICLGYKGYIIKEYFANYFLHTSVVTIDLTDNSLKVHQRNSEPWRVTLVDTGDATMTGGRLKRVADFLEDDETFCFTYGDGLSDININELIEFHSKHGKLATVTATLPPGRFGAITTDQRGVVTTFAEKPNFDGTYINGGYFVLNRKVIDYIHDDSTVWERGPLEDLSAAGELVAFHHRGFWQPMDTLREKNLLEQMWIDGKAAWKKW